MSTNANDYVLKIRLDALQKLDKVKIAYTPLDLGVKMCDRISHEQLSKPILVVSDVGLLCALIRSMRRRGITMFTNVRFLCHVKQHAEFAEKQLKVETIYVPYRKFERFFAKDGVVSYFHDVKFDVIVGNPPYQPEVNSDGGSGSRSLLWPKFVEVSFKLMKDDGHILFVTPNNWRQGNFRKGPASTAQSLMWEEATILWYEDVKKHFEDIGNSITIDAWHLRKGHHSTEIKQHELNACKVLPKNKQHVDIFAKFFSACLSSDVFARIKDHDGRDAAPERSDTHPYKHANTSAWTKAGRFQWMSKKTDGFDDNKVIVARSNDPMPWYSPGGECGTGSSAYGYCVSGPDEGKAIINFYGSDLVKFIVKEMSATENPIGFPVHLFFNLPKSLLTTPWQQVFGFTDDELAIIEGRSPVSVKEAAE